MYPEEREYRVGPMGFTTSRDGVTVRHRPGALVWLVRAPLTADLLPTGQSRRYETKGGEAGHEPTVLARVSAAGEPIIQRKRKGRR